MLHDLDKTLEALLKHETLGIRDNSLREAVSISFAPPDEDFKPPAVTMPAINLFLYEIRERKDLRGGPEEMWRKEENGIVMQKPAPIWIGGSYLITAWADKGWAEKRGGDIFMEEHRILTEVMLVLACNTEIPKETFQGGLATKPPEAILFESEIMSPESPRTQAGYRQNMGIGLKASIHYGVTMGLYAREDLVLEKPIEERVFKVVREEETVEELVFKGTDKNPE